MQPAGASNTASGSRLVRDQRPTSGSLLPSVGVLEQLKSGKQNSNWCLDAPPNRGGITADTDNVHTRRTQACSSCQFGSSPRFQELHACVRRVWTLSVS